MTETVEILAERLKTQEQASAKVWDTLEKLLQAVNEIKISLTHLEVLSKKDAEQDEKLNQLREQILNSEKEYINLRTSIKDSVRDIAAEVKVWRLGVVFAVCILLSIVAGNFEFLRQLFM